MRASVAVVEEVARLARTDPLSLEPRLADEVDPDALDVLVEGGAQVTVDYADRRLLVDESGVQEVGGISAESGRTAENQAFPR